jgi:flavin-binding protein dodecin
MDEFAVSRQYSGKLRTKLAAAMEQSPRPIEFVGASDDTIAEAVRFALARASASLRTLEGAGVVIIPQLRSEGEGPRFRVTLQITSSSDSAVSPPVLSR